VFLTKQLTILTYEKSICLFTTMALAANALAVETGKPRRIFGHNINGKTVKLSDYKGKIVVLESYNSDCPFCANQYQTCDAGIGKRHGQQGVVWLIVNSSTPTIQPPHA